MVRTPRRTSFGMALLAAILWPADGQTDFNGEVLLAPAPANWDGGTPMRESGTVQRIWTRILSPSGDAEESITHIDIPGQTSPDAAARALTLGKDAAADCADPVVSGATAIPAEIGTGASVTVHCEQAGRGIFTVAQAYLGDFNTYAVIRTWRGRAGDPTSPAVSPGTANLWQDYFDRIAICNTLTSPCDPATAQLIHAHPRFEQMRAAPIVPSTVMPQDKVMTAAQTLGTLTGQARACGEDVSPLETKIDRMFATVTGNDKDSTDAITAFRAAAETGETRQKTAGTDECGAVLRTFRQHPSRASAFPRYLETLL